MLKSPFQLYFNTVSMPLYIFVSRINKIVDLHPSHKSTKFQWKYVTIEEM